jgi:hypothetical protein
METVRPELMDALRERLALRDRLPPAGYVPGPNAIITQELVRDPVELIYEDGRRFSTQRWITKCEDVRETSFGSVNFGWVKIGDAFPTPDSVPYFYEPPKRSLFQRLFSVFV